MNKKIRAFLAIELPQNVKGSLESLRQEIHSPLFDVRWVSQKNMHLTLRFFGEIFEKEIQKISEATQMAVAKTAPFQLHLHGLGAFPSVKSPKVIWIGMTQSGPLINLENNLSIELKKLDYPPGDKPFHPHLTLGRAKSTRGKKDLVRLLEKNQNRSLEQMQVDQVTLIKSDLRPTGPVYTALHRFDLIQPQDKADT